VKQMRCVIVDDSAEFAGAARRLLATDGLTVVGMASTSAEALRSADKLRPDVTLVDINLGAENGFALANRRRNHEDDQPILRTITGRDRNRLLDVSVPIALAAPATTPAPHSTNAPSTAAPGRMTQESIPWCRAALAPSPTSLSTQGCAGHFDAGLCRRVPL
jgi:DNA-binding NarL/FixJ family response regulator